MKELKWPHSPQPHDERVIVENQAKRWAYNKQRGQTDAPPVAWPVVTISRESGTQGAELAHRLAERLGFSYWNRVLVAQIARLMRTDATVAKLDEHTRSTVVDLLGLSIFQQQDLPTDYAKQLREVASTVGERIAFVRQSTGRDVTDPIHYDIVIDAGIYAGERLDAVVLMAYLARFGELPLTEQSWTETVPPSGPSMRETAGLGGG